MNNFSDISNLYGKRGGFAWSTRGSLIAALKLEGLNPSTMTADDFSSITFIVRNILTSLSSHIIPSFYLVSRQGLILSPDKNIKHPVAKKLDESRANYLSSLNLSTTDIYLTLECLPSVAKFGKPSVPGLFYLVFFALFNKSSRKNLKTVLSNKEAICYFNSILDEMDVELTEVLNRVQKRLSIVMDSQILTIDQFWCFSRFLTSYDGSLLDKNLSSPSKDWSKYLMDGEIDTVTYADVPCVQFQGGVNRYARFGSIAGFTNDKLAPALFSSGSESPYSFNDDFVFCLRFHPFSTLQKAAFFKGKTDEVSRQNIKVSDLLNQTMDIEKKKYIRKSQLKRVDELDEAMDLPEQWGYVNCHFALFGDPDTFVKRSNTVQSLFEQSGSKIFWETAAMKKVYSSMLPTMVDNPIRKLELNTAHVAALAPIYCESQGQERCYDLDKPSLFTFTTRTKKPFHYSHWSGQVGINFGVGPIGTGKTFTKNIIASHFGKWPAIYRAIDIDAGSEPLAELYGEQGGVFKLDPEKQQALNPFALLDENNGEIYKSRIKRLIVNMINTNDAKDSRSLTSSEEIALETAIANIIRGKKSHQDLVHLYVMLPDTLKNKLQAFVDEGTYSSLYNAKQDSIGNDESLYGVYNLAALKENPILLRLAMSEIFFRTHLTLTNSKFLNIPKYTDIDEAHHMLKNPCDVDEVVHYIRTSRKNMGGLGMWSQNAYEFASLPDWPALRNAASSFFFMADHTADDEVYKNGFQLDSGQIDAIRSLEPRKESLIVQPRINSSQVVQLLVDEDAEALITSQPQERAARIEFIEKYGFDEGIKRTVEFMRNRKEKILNNSRVSL